MKFITEYDLRARFNEQPFTDYRIEKNTRLTPGARQFLSDRRITLLEDGADRSVKVQETDRKRIPEACQACEAADSKKDSLAIAKLLSDVEVLEAEFLVITSQIIETDIEIAGQMSKAGHEFGRIKTLLTDGAADLNISFEGCTGMDKDHFGKDLGNCFDITDFYIQSPNGKIIVQMNALRAKIRAMRLSAAEALSADKEEKRQEAVTEAVNQIINKLSQLICMAAGGENMQKDVIDFKFCDELVEEFKQVVKHPVRSKSSVYYVGVDLGTACVVTVVLDENRKPVAGAYEYADVVRDGMVVDYIGAVDIVRRMKAELEEKLGVEELVYAAAAIPPGTDTLDGGAVKNVVEAAGYLITSLEDESTAANKVLRIQNGAVVDIGGGTTGISIFKDGKVVYVADEPTGGTHFSLVLSGAYRKTFEEAELFKRDRANHKEILPVLKPVIEKVSAIISRHIEGYQVDSISLVGGTCCLAGIEEIIEKNTRIPTYKPIDPMFVTPLGIAYSCTDKER